MRDRMAFWNRGDTPENFLECKLRERYHAFSMKEGLGWWGGIAKASIFFSLQFN